MHAALESVQNSYGAVLAGLSASEAQMHPDSDPNQWCAQELIEHLILTFRGTAGVLEERLRKGRPTDAPHTLEHEERWRRTIMVGRLPLTKSPEPVRPGKLQMSLLSGPELASLFRDALEKMDGLLDQCAEKFGPGPMASHFAFGPLSADQWREFHTVHTRHHLAQLSRIAASVNDGKSANTIG
ncbi:DinB family protein [Alloacidobacterium sp.]|uniref:DinB family protein n=1 Tax=Alloacidobacterium sp. TaxID=2951999 RepID=UPI002D3F1E8B|nr:DUF1569 domain-containing protein [Alloacidobacterium sp.]HYK35302.1 DUF1569 domain-containing protein [Alloacidobacterium sp.]